MKILGSTLTDSDLAALGKALGYVFYNVGVVRINFENHGLGVLSTLQQAGQKTGSCRKLTIILNLMHNNSFYW